MFCKNCGIEIDNAIYCPKCGQKIEEEAAAAEKSIATVTSPRSLSFILQAILCVIAIALLFGKKYALCYEKTPLTGANTYYQSYWNFSNSSIWGLIAIFWMITPIVFSVIHFFVNKKALAFVSIGCSISAMLYMVFSSVYLSELFSASDRFVSSIFYGTMKYEYDFLSFSVLFYVILAILAASIVISVFDAINKPLIKSKK